MNVISVEEALEFAEENFPNAPEKLAELLKVEVRRASFKGDGWCLTDGLRASIMLNDQVSTSRQRFTLAHELGHLLLGIPSPIGETIRELQNTNSAEEKRVNAVAAQILLPPKIVESYIPELPISIGTLKRLAKKATVSELVVARRLVSMAGELGLVSAAIIHYQDSTYKWQFGTKPLMTATTANLILLECQQSSTQIRQEVQGDSDEDEEIIVADLIENPYFSMQTVFLQRVRAYDCPSESSEVVIKRLEGELLLGDKGLKNSLEGCFGHMRIKVMALSLEEAVALFNARYLYREDRWDYGFRQRLLSPDGQRYIGLRLRIWTKK